MENKKRRLAILIVLKGVHVMENFNRSLLKEYFKINSGDIDPSAISFCAGVDQVAKILPETARSIVKELYDQRSNLKLIASENYSSIGVQMAQGNLLTDKYAEGYPYHRFYAGCDNVDAIEAKAVSLACELFGAKHAYVQPHSGADANMVAYLAILSARTQKPILDELGESNLSKLSREDWGKVKAEFLNQKLLAMDYYSGGHLTHGYRHNFSGTLFDCYSYAVDTETKLLNLDSIREQLREIRPTILLAGYSAYSRKINFAKMREMADEVGAVFMVDMSHFSGLVAGKVFAGDFNPVKFAHVVTSTTHKTLRGPRGGIVLCDDEFKEYVDKGCPSILGGPLPHVMAAKAVAFKEALTEDFKMYAHKVVENAQNLAEACMKEGLEVLTGGTENHLLLIDVNKLGITGRQAESALRECNITLNRNSLPDDPNGPWYTSGLRIGTPAITSLGMGFSEMEEIAKVIKLVVSNIEPVMNSEGKNIRKKNLAKYSLSHNVKEEAQKKIKDVLSGYPLYPQINVDIKSYLE
jgi:glycine hydroxymethyltransferase